VITTPHARVTVVGTRVRLAVSKAQTRVEVDEGLVRVTSLVSDGLVHLKARQTAIIDASCNRLYVLGEILLVEDFEAGMDDWQVHSETEDGLILEASKTAKEAVYVSSVRRGITSRKALVIDALALTNEWINVRYKKLFPGEACAVEADYSGIRARQGGSYNVGCVVETPAEIMAMEKDPPDGSAPTLTVHLGKWYTWKNDYYLSRDSEGRPIVFGVNRIDDRELYRSRAIFPVGADTPLRLRVAVKDAKVAVDRIVLRRLVRKPEPVLPEP
jgi:hypothetical protein